MPHLTCRVEDRDHRELRAAAALDALPVSDVVRRALRREARAVLARAPDGWGEDGDLEPWACGSCEEPVSSADAFCRSCGASLTEDAPA